MIIDERESEETDQIPKASQFSTSVIALDQQMDTTERNPTPKIEPATTQAQTTTIDHPLGTTSRFQPYDQNDLFYWKGTAFSRQQLWNQIRTGL